MTDEHKDIAWLKKQLIGLMEDARNQDPTDHGACAKYADLLWKLMGKTLDIDPKSLELDDLRRKLIDGDKAD